MAVRTNRAIVYHIPKCGGTWVKVAMKAAGLTYRATRNLGPHPFGLKNAHATPDMIPERYKDGLYSIAFVRHPLAWYRSYWAFRMRKGARRDEAFPADGLWSDDFSEFVDNVLDAYPGGFVTALYQYYVGEAGDGVAYIGRTENLANDLVDALFKAGEDFNPWEIFDTAAQNAGIDKWKRAAQYQPDTAFRVLDAERWVTERFYG